MYMHPLDKCLGTHGSNSTVEFHDCMCTFDYSKTRSRVKALKMKHCLEAAKIYKLNNFYTYLGAAGIAVVVLVALIAAFCSCKWYLETNEYPCNCCSFFCFCGKKRKKKSSSDSFADDTMTEVYEQTANGHSWAPVTLPPSKDDFDGESSPEMKRKGLCMNFCLSAPVQDCCEFFDCDFLWRKRSTQNIPVLGRRKPPPSNFVRQPSRPAPPPPKAVVLPQMKHPEPIFDEYGYDCEPVPEAPPSPEPVRVLNPRSLYVDPMSFLQKPFMKPYTEKEEENKPEKGEPIYNKFKNMVLSRVKKGGSNTSINNVGVSNNPNGVSINPNNRNQITGSLASLHNLGDSVDESSCGSKRSMSLASLRMLDDTSFITNDARSRISVVSHTTDDIPPSARKDEYIDLEEMSRKMAEKRRLQELAQQADNETTNPTSTLPKNYTPNFIPASAFPNTPYQQAQVPVDMSYYPAVPASRGRPAVPARTLVSSPSNTLGRPKPVVPPRTPLSYEMDRNSLRNMSHSQQQHTLPRSPRLVKPNVPPPPPPNPNKPPMESSL